MPKKAEKPAGLFPQKHKTLVRVTYGIFLFLFSISSLSLLYIIETKEKAFTDFALQTEEENHTITTTAFPIGVNPFTETITENPTVDTFLEVHLGGATKNTSKVSWLQNHVYAILASLAWYQNLASPISRILVIEQGERKEEIANNFGDILLWDTEERGKFIGLVAGSSPAFEEGTFFPGRYVTSNDATPEMVAYHVTERFNQHIASRYTPELEAVVPLKNTLTIASLLEREAYDFEDMRYISGIIWNRLFSGMNLQLDASLQYAKAKSVDANWWPVPVPSDKKIQSPFNTYKHKGLPPSAIANPSAEAILAALNPKATECMFYFHDKQAGFHCTKTYEEHVALLKQYYGQGK